MKKITDCGTSALGGEAGRRLWLLLVAGPAPPSAGGRGSRRSESLDGSPRASGLCRLRVKGTRGGSRVFPGYKGPGSSGVQIAGTGLQDAVVAGSIGSNCFVSLGHLTQE